MNDIHHSYPAIECHVHILAEHVDAIWHGFDQVLSGTDGLFQYVTDGGVKKGLLIREVPV